MSLRRLTVFLSSTGKDLAEYRRAIIDHMRPLDGFICDAMEEFGARDVSALPFCRQRVSNADVLVGLIGNYRGWEPASDNQQRSITELEYTWAGEAGRSRLMYVAPDDTAVPDHLTMTPDGAVRQKAFRATILAQDLHDERFYKSQFSNPADLAAAVMAALANVQYRQMLLLIQKAAASPGASLPPTDTDAASGPLDALTAFAAEPELAPVLADAETFDVSELEAVALTRAEKLETDARAMVENAEAQRRAAADEYKRLADLTGFYDVRKALRYLEKATAADPTDVSAWLKLGRRYAAAGRSDSALDAALTASARARDSGNEHAIYLAHMAVGDALVIKGDLREALERYHGALAASYKRAALAPGDAAREHEISAAHSRIGETQVLQGDLQSASASFKASFDITERVAAANPANSDWQNALAVAHNKIAEVHLQQGDVRTALREFNASHAIFKSLAEADPQDAKRQNDLAVSYDKIAYVLAAQRDFADALHYFEIARAIRKQLAEADPANAIWRRNLAISEIAIGDVYMEQQDPTGAAPHFEAAAAILRQVTDADPGHAEWQHDLGVAIEHIADLERAQGDYAAALKSYRAKYDISANLVAADPTNARWRRDLSVAHGKLGMVLCEQGDLASALENLQTALAIDEQILRTNPTDVGWQRMMAAHHERIARVYQRLNDRDSERMSYQRALVIYDALLARNPDDPATLAWSLTPRWILGTTTYPDGRAHLERAIAILENLERQNRLDPRRRTWVAKIKSDLAELYDE